MKSKRIKLICNCIILIIAICSIFKLLQFSELPNVFRLSFMNKPEGDFEIQLGIYTGLIVTSFFYLIINFIPEQIKEMEEEEMNMPYLCRMHREIQLFVSDFLQFWADVFKCATKTDSNINLDKIKTPKDMFEISRITRAASKIRMSDKSARINVNNINTTWDVEFSNYINGVSRRGRQLFNQYQRDIPYNIYSDIYYLIESSPLLGIPYNSYDIMKQISDANSLLIQFIPINLVSGEINVKDSAECINEIYEWVNSEYKKLSKEKELMSKCPVYNINFKNYFS